MRRFKMSDKNLRVESARELGGIGAFQKQFHGFF